MAEVYAGFLAHIDDQIGRLLAYLEETDQLENTLIVLVSDNGASGEGGPNGSVNENKFFNGVPDDVEANLALLDDLGSPKTYNHYPNGWAMAFNTPFKMWKRYEFNGGSCDPCIISWPKAITARGEIRHQYHHAIDIVPTILDCLGVEAPETIKGHVQSGFDGVSMRYSFNDGDAPGRRKTQFYSMLGSRAIWHEGWKAVSTHPTISGWSNFNDDTWELYNVEVDRAELHDLAAEHPDKVRELVNLWFSEAGANRCVPARRPLRGRDPQHPAATAHEPARPLPLLPRHRRRPRGAVGQHPQPQLHHRRARRYPRRRRRAVCCSRRDPTSAAMRCTSRTTVFTTSTTSSGWSSSTSSRTQDVPTGENLILSASFVKDGEDPPGVSTGIVSLFHGEEKVGEGRIKTQPSAFGLSGTDLVVGRAISNVTDDFPGERPWAFTGGNDQDGRGRRQRRSLRRPRARRRGDDRQGIVS